MQSNRITWKLTLALSLCAFFITPSTAKQSTEIREQLKNLSYSSCMGCHLEEANFKASTQQTLKKQTALAKKMSPHS